MRLTPKFSVVRTRRSRKASPHTQTSKKSTVLDKIFKLLKPTADKVGSRLSAERRGNSVNLFLSNRPKDRPGRLAWNDETERIAESCRSRFGSISVNIVPARNGNELEITRNH
jgi:hypothetical protein